MSTVQSLKNSTLTEEDELSQLLSQVQLSSRSQSRATVSAPPSLRGSLQASRRRRPPPVDQIFFTAPPLSPERISPIFSIDDNISQTLVTPKLEPQSPTSSDGDSSFDNTIASIRREDLHAMGDAGPESQRHGKHRKLAYVLLTFFIEYQTIH